MLWNQGVHTDREVLTNRPDIVIKNEKKKICSLIYVAMSADRNATQKEAVKKRIRQRLYNCELIRLLYNGPFESFMTTTRKTV